MIWLLVAALFGPQILLALNGVGLERLHRRISSRVTRQDL